MPASFLLLLFGVAAVSFLLDEPGNDTLDAAGLRDDVFLDDERDFFRRSPDFFDDVDDNDDLLDERDDRDDERDDDDDRLLFIDLDSFKNKIFYYLFIQLLK